MVDTLIVQPASQKLARMVAASSILPINRGLGSATERTMVSILDSPKMPLTTESQGECASDLAKRSAVTADIAPRLRVRGTAPAVESLQAVLADEPDHKDVLTTQGMLSVRLREPTDGSVSKEISNHAWGRAVVSKLISKNAPGNTGFQVPRFVGLLVPFFNQAGWFSGAAFPRPFPDPSRQRSVSRHA